MERMQESDNYDAAIQRISNIVLDQDEYPSLIYARLFQIVPVGDVAPLLAERVSDCSKEELLRIIWYCQLFAITDSVEELLLAVMTDGVDNLREAESIQRNILSALSSSPLGTAHVMSSQKYERELAVVRGWQEDRDLPISVRNFARTAEDYLLDDLDRWDRFEEDLF